MTTPTSYRQLALVTAGQSIPLAESLSTLWSGPGAPAPGPSTLFRWLDRLARSAGAWWSALAPEVQARMDSALRPPDPPKHLAARAGFLAKRQALTEAWRLLWLLGDDWLDLLRRAPRRPAGLDSTGLFLHRVLVPL